MVQNTNPSVDSLNSDAVQVQMKYSIKKNFKLGIKASYLSFKSGGFKHESGLNADWVINNHNSLRAEINVGKIYHIWGIDNANLFNGMLSWLVSF